MPRHLDCYPLNCRSNNVGVHQQTCQTHYKIVYNRKINQFATTRNSGLSKERLVPQLRGNSYRSSSQVSVLALRADLPIFGVPCPIGNGHTRLAEGKMGKSGREADTWEFVLPLIYKGILSLWRQLPLHSWFVGANIGVDNTGLTYRYSTLPSIRER
jgi:hypothetical protein